MTEKEIYQRAKECGATFAMTWCSEESSVAKMVVLLDDLDSLVCSPTEFIEVSETEIPQDILAELKLGRCNTFFLSVSGASGIAYKKTPLPFRTEATEKKKLLD